MAGPNGHGKVHSTGLEVNETSFHLMKHPARTPPDPKHRDE
jgi:hypothetical protein